MTYLNINNIIIMLLLHVLRLHHIQRGNDIKFFSSFGIGNLLRFHKILNI